MTDRQTLRQWLLTPRGITWGNFAVNLTVAVAKIAAGAFCRSQALLADGFHSASDFATDIAVLAGLRVSSKPADPCHPYGHRRVSTLVAMFVGVALGGAAIWIAYDAIQAFHAFLDGRRGLIRADLAFWVALSSAPVKEGLFRVTRWVGRREGDVSIVANAWHSRADGFAALATAVGLGGVAFGGPRWQFLDPLTATVLAAFLVVAAYKIATTSAAELVDRAPTDADLLASIARSARDTSGVRGYHAFRARQIGGKVAMDIHIQVDPDLTVRQGHQIAGAVKRQVMAAHGDVTEVIVHIEPAEDPDRKQG